MKANIHPETKNSKVTCACGNAFETTSTVEVINVEVCHKCHPAYDGNTKTAIKKTGNIDKFNKKYNLDEK